MFALRDPNSARSFLSKIDAHAAVLVAADNVPPTGTVLINDGAKRTRKAIVRLTISASDNEGGSGVGSMRFSNDGTNWLEWEPYATSKTWTRSRGGGTKTVYVEFCDEAGNVTDAAKDTIRKSSRR